MPQEKTVQYFTDKIVKNSNLVTPYKNYEFYLFCEIRPIIFEGINCIMLELSQASICITNHILERALKISLIHDDIGDDNISTPGFFDTLNTAYSCYDGLTLNDTINKSFDKGLINKEEKELIMHWKNQHRNPASHANVSSILPNKGKNVYFRGFIGTYGTDSKQEDKTNPFGIREALIPVLLTAQHFQQTRAEQTYIQYFEEVFNLMKNLDDRFKAKFNVTFPQDCDDE